jgi:glutamine amidotransferase
MIGVIDYGMGNLKSVEKAFSFLGFQAEIIKEPEQLKNYSKLVLPGVGAFGDAISALKQAGLDQAIKTAVSAGHYFLGICLGMQLLFDISYEGGSYVGLGILPGKIRRLDDNSTIKFGKNGLKIPHMGWNSLNIHKPEPLFRGLASEPFVYFDHAYYLDTAADVVSASCQYGRLFHAAAQKDRVFCVQFHPEKSGDVGLKILTNFGNLEDSCGFTQQ